MLLAFYAAMVSSPLVVTVADRIPKFDVGQSCRESTVPDCLNMEKIARDKLVKDWHTFTARDKAQCVTEEKISGPPSYVGWLTCLGINANARSSAANGVVDSNAPPAATGNEAQPKQHNRIRHRQ